MSEQQDYPADRTLRSDRQQKLVWMILLPVFNWRENKSYTVKNLSLDILLTGARTTLRLRMPTISAAARATSATAASHTQAYSAC